MLLIVILLMLLASLAIVAALLQVSAFMLRRARVSWLHCFALAGLWSLLGFVVRWFPMRAIGAVPSMMIGMAIVVAIGGWFLTGRAVRADGRAFVFADGAKLSALAIAGMVLFWAVAGSISYNFGPMRMLHR